MSEDEQRRRLVDILTKLVDVLDCEELSLLAHHCGISIAEFYSEPELIEFDLKEAA